MASGIYPTIVDVFEDTEVGVGKTSGSCEFLDFPRYKNRVDMTAIRIKMMNNINANLGIL